MQYMINVDLESLNVSDGSGGTYCRSALHAAHGPHFDLTVHALDCAHRNVRAVQRPPTRYWDDNDGRGYTLDEVISIIEDIQLEAKDSYPRRCRHCKVEPNPPHWD